MNTNNAERHSKATNVNSLGCAPLECETCMIRKAVARAFDLHWFGKDDCPYECDGHAFAQSNK